MADLSVSVGHHGIGTKPVRVEDLGGQLPLGKRASHLRCLIAILGVIFTTIPALTQIPTQTQRPDAPYVISVHVNMVVLRLTVLDRKNASVSGLDKESFRVLEDGVLQQVKYFSHEDIPVTVGLVIDNSGSMRTKRSEVIAAALAFARSSNPRDQFFVVNFNEKVSLALPEKTPFTDNVPELEVALSRVAARGETALYDAIDVALDQLSKGDRDKKVLVIVSDGGDNASKHKLESILAKAKRSDAIIYSIGIFDAQDSDSNPHVLKRFAEETGGETFLPESVKEVVPICERIARDIRSQYSLAYVPINTSQDGSYRVVQVRASATGQGRLSVRTRAGYFAPAATSTSLVDIRHELH